MHFIMSEVLLCRWANEMIKVIENVDKDIAEGSSSSSTEYCITVILINKVEHKVDINPAINSQARGRGLMSCF